MSNPARAPREQLTEMQQSLSLAPDAYLKYEDKAKFLKIQARIGDIATIQDYLKGKDMEVRSAIVLPKERCVDVSVTNTPKEVLAKAAKGSLRPRVRTVDGKGGANAIYSLLPVEGFGPFTKEGVSVAMKDKFFMSGGAEYTLGRLQLAYPSIGSGARLVPPSITEVAGALRGSGVAVSKYDLPRAAFRSYPIVAPEGEVGVSLNAKSDNGFPVLGKWDTPGAQEKILELVAQMRADFSKHSDIPARIRELELTEPSLVTLQGKAKSDYYPMAKIENFQLRFYNVVPRQLMLIMQMGTQPFEAMCRTMADDKNVRTAMGSTLTRRGATAMVAHLDRQFDDTRVSFGYVHAGDDSWLAGRVLTSEGEFAIMCDLDCSNFDLTQHSAVTKPVHDAFRRELQPFDRVAADVWYALMRERQVAVAGTVIRTFKHAGPSGMPLQSKVNDVLMEILLARTVRVFIAWHHNFRSGAPTQFGTAPALPSVAEVEAALRRIAFAEAEKMGFVLKLENFGSVLLSSSTRATPVRTYLAHRPFKFIGYYFFAPPDPSYPGEVRVFTDLPRTMAQMPYPSLKWMAPKDVKITEAMRLGSMLIAMGIPPPVLEPAIASFERYVVGLIEAAIAAHGDVPDKRLRWAVSENPFAGPTEASLTGLLRAVRNRKGLWLDSAELPATSVLVPVKFSWADQMDFPDEPELWAPFQAPKALPPVPAEEFPLPRAGPLRERPKPTHPPTLRNDGRPPPTAVWGPDKPPMRREEALRVLKDRRRRGGRGRDKRMDAWSEGESEAWSEQTAGAYDLYELD